MIVAKFVDLVTHRKQPSAVAFGFFSYVALPFSGGKHFEARTHEVVDPDRAFGAHYLIAEIHATPECPANLKLTDSAVFILHQCDGVVFRFDRFHLCIRPAHYFEGKDIFAYVAPRDLYTMAAQVKYSTAAGLFQVPEPIAVRAWMCLARLGPE